jgi:hypothetical protein
VPFHIQIESFEKPDVVFFTDLFSTVISPYFRACQNNNWGHMEWEQFQVGSDLLKNQTKQNIKHLPTLEYYILDPFSKAGFVAHKGVDFWS